jgi:hypothetical protein
MASTDWTFLNDGLDAATVARGVTAGIAAPPGGGAFVYGFNSRSLAKGAVALFANQPNFAPMSKGGSIRSCVQRGPGGGATGFAPFLFLCGQGTSVNDNAYLLGLSDDDPHRIVLRKGSIAASATGADAPGALMHSSESFVQGTWLHVRLDVVVNTNGDVVLSAFRNDLGKHPIGSAPDWEPIAGMATFIDDALAINSGSKPFTSGRGGFGFAVTDVTRRGYFDQLELARQT